MLNKNINTKIIFENNNIMKSTFYFSIKIFCLRNYFKINGIAFKSKLH